MGFVPFMGFNSYTFKLLNLAFYLVNSYAIFKLALIRNVAYPWMAFIPFFNLFMFGSIGDSLKYTNSKIEETLGNIPLAYALPIASIVISMLGGLIGSIGKILIQVVSIVVYYLVFSFYSYNNRVLFTVLSIIPIVGPALILYSLRNHRL